MTEREITELLFVRDPPGRSEVALVLGHHDPAVAARRARHAARLYLDGLTPRLILSGGDPGQAGTSEAEVMAGVVAGLGVPPAAVLVEEESRTTAENLRRSVEFLRAENLLPALSTVHLVSCPWHMRRASLLARAVFPPGVRLICSPHDESCTAASWASSPDCRDVVIAEARLLRALLRSDGDRDDRRG